MKYQINQITKFSLATALLIATAIIFFGNSSCSSNTKPKQISPDVPSMMSVSAVKLKTSMRKLWADHVLWTRNVILCLVDDLPGTDQAVKRLLQNQVDIGNVFKTYYGDEAGKQLTELLYPHINISAEVVKATKADDKAALAEANIRWYANSDEMAEFFSNANPKWELTEMKMMMQEHLQFTAHEAEQRITKNYDADILAFDKINSEILIMADMFADGIIEQFPGKFNTGTPDLAAKIK